MEYHKKPYRTMRAALDSGSRDIVYSLCQYGNGDVWNWGNDPDIKGNLWRTTGDIGPSFSSMMSIGLKQPQISAHSGPGHWNDPDMLFLHALKPNEQITHLTIWSMLAAPLLIGSDIAKLPRFTLDALSNDEVIAIDQDPLGKAATVRSRSESGQVWSRPLWDGTQAVALINPGRTASPITVRWRDLGVSGQQPVRDLWRQKDVGTIKGKMTQLVPPHGSLLFKIGRARAKDYRPASGK